MRSPFVACLAACFIPLLAGGCATDSGWRTRSAPENFVDGSVVLAEAILPARREQVLAGEGLLAGWRDTLLAAGYRDEEIVDGSELTVWTFCYGHNSGVPICAHHGHYVAHVPESLRGRIKGNEDGSASGELVTVRLRRQADGRLFGEVLEIYRQGADWGNCKQARLQPGDLTVAMSALSLIGPPRAIWIECADAERDGWARRPVAGAPSSLDTPVSEWVRLPR